MKMLRPNRTNARRRAFRPACQALEGRSLMASSIFDPTFGIRGIAAGAVDTRAGTALSSGDAIAVAPDGKVVVAGITRAGAGGTLRLGVRRFDADGSPDPTFGTGGLAILPPPASPPSFDTPPESVAIRADGSVVVAYGSVYQLTPAGVLDAGFGTNGVYNPAAGVGLSAVALQPDGKVVAGGTGEVGTFEVVRLTTAGAPDATFNDTGTQAITVTTQGGSNVGQGVSAVAVAPNGQVYVAGFVWPLNNKPFPQYPTLGFSRINADGTLDAAFNSAFSQGNPNLSGAVPTAIAVAPDNSVVLAGFSYIATNVPLLTRIRPDGSVDPSFRSVGFGDYPAAPAFDLYSSVVVAADGTITLGGRTGINNKISNGFISKALVERLHADGTPDPAFGKDGRYYFNAPGGTNLPQGTTLTTAVALADDGSVLATGGVYNTYGSFSVLSQRSYVARLLPAATPGATPPAPPGDYDGDGVSDIAAYLPDRGIYAIRPAVKIANPSAGFADYLLTFGSAGAGASIPAPGDYDGDGATDIAVYLPQFGALAVAPSDGAAPYLVPFGSAGQGASIPAPGDYDGDGTTDVAVYLPQYGALAVRPSGGTANYLVTFGSAGPDGSIPAPGDYDGDGKTDVAVYLPAFGQLAVRPSSGAAPYLVTFGSAGVGGSIPAPGDYDGDGKTDVAVYLPAYGGFAVRPSGGTSPYLFAYGRAGVGGSIPAPGDYDGDGRTDPALYLPADALFASIASSTQVATTQPFGIPGSGSTVPAAAIGSGRPAVVAASSFSGSAASAGYLVALDVALLPPATGARKPRA